MTTSIRDQIAANRRLVAAVDRAHVDDALGSVTWERRGLFQRLVIRP
jgi:hypothetical protein